ncbi:hypothetical protein Aasi_1417 [Candidatus Amoebophilus asiaticus 5a2]|uniref:Uncharacterized protein n=1 Tax=Amoebophilus asiaticus (strain 5a2) TaxID=452471 RepID=B3EU08_AMOA5|nr:neuraminidase-like domain-containing protein [Candidatus Amoebophilus asiaticus]ACE06710.1 hypothetical protein Aasi_1417 [Candidatus Amoebophilus asiaticus 5a2]
MATTTNNQKINLVVGKVTDGNSLPLPNIKVEIYDIDMRDWQLLADTYTNRDGAYELSWTYDQLSGKEKKTADIAVRILTPVNNIELYKSSVDEVRFNAAEREEINITLAQPIPVEVIEYDFLLKEVTSLADKIDITELQESKDQRDITFLSKELEVPAEKIVYLVVAHKMGEISEIEPAFFYALLRKNTLLKNPSSPFFGTRFSIGIQDDPQILLYDAALAKPEAIQEDLKAAIAEMIVGPKLTNESAGYIKQLQKYRDQAEEYYKNQHPQKAIEVISRFVTEGKLQEIATLFKENQNDFNTFFDKITDSSFFNVDSKATDAKTHIALGQLFGFGNEIIPQIIKKYKIKNPTDIRKLAKLNTADWIKEIAKIKGDTADKDLINTYALSIVQRFEKVFPTIAFAAQLEREKNPILNNQDKMVAFFNKYEDFDLTKDTLDLYLKAKEIDKKDANLIVDELKRVQRVFKLVPNYSKTLALLQENIHSSQHIAALGKTRFIEEFAPKVGIDEREATEIYHKAEAKHTAAMILAGQLQDIAGVADIASFNKDAISRKLASVSDDFPNLKTLFKLTDTCACEHCRSVYSPAAYLVELLQSLDKRAVVDLNAPQVSTNAKDVLFNRRPDLGEIDLSCANANTPVKYIDLVCELLEEAITPDPGIDYTGLLSDGADPLKGKISTELLKTLTNNALTNANIPVTDKAVIYETETNNDPADVLPHYVRDSKAVCKIVNNGANTYKIYRLRQTLSSAEELDAAPEYVNKEAYKKLSESKFAFTLPFDLYHTEAKAYFDRFGVNRAEIMKAFQTAGTTVPSTPPLTPLTRLIIPPDGSIAAEKLGLTDAERTLIVSPKPTLADQQEYWNVPGPDNVVDYMKQVDHFLDKTGITYKELELLLKLKFIDQTGTLFIKHKNLSCDTAKKEIPNLDLEALDRIHRFLRLQKKTGWKYEVLDEMISQPALGKNKLDNDCLIMLSRLKEISERTTINLEELIGFYGEIPYIILDEESPKPLYHQIFLNKAKNGFIEEKLLVENILSNEAGIKNPASKPPGWAPIKIQELQTSISTCLQIKEKELFNKDLLLLPSDANLTFSNLSFLFAASRLMSKLKLKTEDFVILTNLSEIKTPGKSISDSPQYTLDFIQLVGDIKKSPLKPADLEFMFHHKAQNISARVISDENVIEILKKLQKEYQSNFTDNQSLFDDKLSAEEQKETLQKELTKLIGVKEDVDREEDIITEEDVKTLIGFIDKNWSSNATKVEDATKVEEFIEKKVKEFFKEVNDIVDKKLGKLLDISLIKPIKDKIEEKGKIKEIEDAAIPYVKTLHSVKTARETLNKARTPAEIAVAQAALTAAEDELNITLTKYNIASKNLLQALLDSLALFQRLIGKRDILEQIITNSFKADIELVKIALKYAQLKKFAPDDGLLGDILMDDSLIGIDTTHVVPVLPAITSSEFDKQFAAIRFLHKFLPFVQAFGLNNSDLKWHLQYNNDANWLKLDSIPYDTDTGQTPADFQQYINFIKLLDLKKQLSPVPNPSDAEHLISFYTLADMLRKTASTVTRSQFLTVFSLLIGYEKADIDAIDAHLFGGGDIISHYQEADNWHRVIACAEYLRKLNSDVAQIKQYIQPTLSTDEVGILRAALKARYDEDTWLGTLKEIMDAIRLQKRDALVAYLLARNPDAPNKPKFKDVNDLYDHFLIDVEMEACMPSSRIVQAHNSIQLFVQRCLMGLESKAIVNVDKDPNWNQWKWMKNYRVWEANRKVFLYPENWYDVTLTEGKSYLLTEFINELQQNELTENTANEAFIKYLEKLDNIAFLEVMASWYQTDTKVMHVFARTKGGDPAIYYYRRFEQERYWTPWEKVELDITGDHLLAFMRNNRLHLAWPIFSEGPDPGQGAKLPDQQRTDEQSIDKPRKKLKIQLAISEYSNKKWQPKKVSKEGILTPSIATANEEDLNLKRDKYHLLYLQQFDQILIFSNLEKIEDYYQRNGVFNLTGCKGYPELLVQEKLGHFPDFYPDFKGMELKAQRYNEIPFRATDDLVVKNVISIFQNLERSYEILEKTPNKFRITYPHQLTNIDLLVLALRTLLSSLFRKTRSSIEAPLFRIDQFKMPLGTLLPYFKEDSNHAYVIIPGFYKKLQKDQQGYSLTDAVKGTASDIFPLINDINNWVMKFVANLPSDANEAIQKLMTDAEFWEILKKMSKYESFDILFNFLIGNTKDGDTKFDEFLNKLKNEEGLIYGEQFKNLYHPLVCYLRTILNKEGISGLMKRDTQLFKTVFDFEKHYDPNKQLIPKTFLKNKNGSRSLSYPIEDLDFTIEGSYSVYNWDLFFRIPLHIATSLTKNQRFEEALAWFHYIFNPTGALSGNGVQKYWVTKPFYLNQDTDYINQQIDTLLRLSSTTESDTSESSTTEPDPQEIRDLESAIEKWRNKPFSPDVIAWSRPVAYQKAVLMKYIDNLTEWGDHLFRQDTMESIAQATQMYILADKLLGPKPRIIPTAVEQPYETYNQIERKLDTFGNVFIELENILPDLSVLPEKGTELPATPSSLPIPYFCVPQNDKLLEYWDRIEDRLFKIRHCQNIDGVERSLALFAPPIDPGVLVRATAAGLDITSVLTGLNVPTPYYRFNVFSQKATELAQEVRGLGNSLLQALEKKDAEALSLLRNELELKVLNAVRDIKVLQINEAKEQIEVLKRTKIVTEERHKYYAQIQKIIAGEQLSLNLLESAHDKHQAAQQINIAASLLGYLPNVTIGVSGFGGSPHVNTQWGTQNIISALQAMAGSEGNMANMFSYQAGRASTLAGYGRRFDDWKLQECLAQKEIDSIDKQIVAAEIRKEIAETDLRNHELQIDNAKKTDEFMHSKFTNKELYDWMIGQISAVYFKSYQLAYDVAKKAERSYRFELGNDDTFISYGYWDSLKKGLQSADHLIHDIKRMEISYLDKNKREYEITKHISLAQLDPLALIRLRATGVCDFEIPEVLYDMDHPGQYFRRIKLVSISLPCIAGPYTSVSAKLSLVNNRYRKNTNAGTGYAEDPGNDERFIYNIGAIQSIATSNAQNDSGIFELNFRDERYLPFEGTGAISGWRLELPKEIRQFDYNTIADLIVHVKYTAREGGSSLKTLAESNLKSKLADIKQQLEQTGLHIALNIKHDMPNEWHMLKNKGDVRLTIDKSRLPYFVQSLNAKIENVMFIAKVKENPATYSIKIDTNNIELSRIDEWKLCKGNKDGIQLDTYSFVLSVSQGELAKLEELMMVIKYVF